VGLSAEQSRRRIHPHLGDPPLLHIRLLDRQGQVLKGSTIGVLSWHWNKTDRGDKANACKLLIGFVFPFLYYAENYMEVVDIPRQKTLASIDVESTVIHPFCRRHPPGLGAALRVPPTDVRIVNGVAGAGTTVQRRFRRRHASISLWLMQRRRVGLWMVLASRCADAASLCWPSDKVINTIGYDQ